MVNKEDQTVTVVMSAHYYDIGGGWIEVAEEEDLVFKPVPKDEQSMMPGCGTKDDFVYITGKADRIRQLLEGCTHDCSYTQLTIYLTAHPIGLVRKFIDDILDGWQEDGQATYDGHFIL